MKTMLTLTTYVAATQADVLARISRESWYPEAPHGTEVHLADQDGMTELRVMVPWSDATSFGANEHTLVASRLFNRLTTALAA